MTVSSHSDAAPIPTGVPGLDDIVAGGYAANRAHLIEGRGARRITLEGPSVELSADLAVPIGMAVHELTTNAAKHGALSVPGGRIAVVWTVRDLEAGRRLAIDWVERGGPPVAQPSRKGFGSTLLHRVLTHQCRATINIAYDQVGLSCHMEIPLVEERLVPKYGD